MRFATRLKELWGVLPPRTKDAVGGECGGFPCSIVICGGEAGLFASALQASTGSMQPSFSILSAPRRQLLAQSPQPEGSTRLARPQLHDVTAKGGEDEHFESGSHLTEFFHILPISAKGRNIRVCSPRHPYRDFAVQPSRTYRKG